MQQRNPRSEDWFVKTALCYLQDVAQVMFLEDWELPPPPAGFKSAVRCVTRQHDGCFLWLGGKKQPKTTGSLSNSASF